MGKIFIIAKREYRAMVATKAFLIVLTIMPIFMGGGIVAQKFLVGRVSTKQKTIVVLDGTGKLFDTLVEAAEARNSREIFDLATGKQNKPRYHLKGGPPGPVTEETRFELSEQIRQQQIHAFVELPVEILEMPPAEQPAEVMFYAENVVLSEEKRWLQQVLNHAVRTHRLEQAGLDPELVGRASAPVPIEGLGLLKRSEGGRIEEAQRSDEGLTIFLPFGMMMLMFVVIFMAAQPMLEAVLEEKGQRIAEVLLGSANATQLMIGKLLGGVGGSLTIVATYAMGGYVLARYYEVTQHVPLRIVPWFLVYQVLAVMLFGSVFMAVGAAVNDLKEAQGLLLPVWLLLCAPMLVWLPVIREPTSSFATWASLFPPATPLLMVVRLVASDAIPWWQPLLGIVGLLATTFLGVFAAGRIFRIGILTQGKTPKLTELVRWAVRA